MNALILMMLLVIWLLWINDSVGTWCLKCYFDSILWYLAALRLPPSVSHMWFLVRSPIYCRQLLNPNLYTWSGGIFIMNEYNAYKYHNRCIILDYSFWITLTCRYIFDSIHLWGIDVSRSVSHVNLKNKCQNQRSQSK